MKYPFSRAKPLGEHWQVRVLGDPNDLWFLARELANEPTRVVPDSFEPGGYVLIFEKFLSSSQHEAIGVLGQEIATCLTGVLRCADGSMTPLSTCATYWVREDGQRETFAPVEGRSHKFRPSRVSPAMTVAIENAIEPLPTTTQLLYRAMETDVAVEQAMRLCAEANAQTWSGLAAIREVIEADAGGPNNLQEMRWVSSSELEAFCLSVRRAVRYEPIACRGEDQLGLLRNLMTLSEGKEHVERLRRHWLRSKGVSI